MKALTIAWMDVRKNFFPRFDKDNRWQAKKGLFTSMIYEMGYCDSDRRIVYVAPRAFSQDGNGNTLRTLLIHELTHAVLCDSSHGKRFRRRLEAAKSIALKLRRHELAETLEREIDDYAIGNVEVVPVSAVYSDMEDLVTERRPKTYDDAFRFLSQRYPIHFLRKCRRLRASYDQAIKYLETLATAK